MASTPGSQKALLTHSCTAALEMTALLANLKPGDEVIMPSYTFVSTANAFVLRGVTPVFVDIRADTLNLDETKLDGAITARTKAIVPVHYAGVGCEMDTICAIAERNNLLVIEDAAQAVSASYKGKMLGSIGHMAALSFHETKNVICGEGGALLINDASFVERAEIIREKGTNRSKFFRGNVDKYTWVDLGSSFLPGELTAAFLAAQLDASAEILRRRLAIWNSYHVAFEELELRGVCVRPTVPRECLHNSHIYYLLLPTLALRTEFIAKMREKGINCVFHYVPLHSSPAGMKFGRISGSMDVTNDISERLVRLPLWLGLEDQQQRVIDAVRSIL